VNRHYDNTSEWQFFIGTQLLSKNKHLDATAEAATKQKHTCILGTLKQYDGNYSRFGNMSREKILTSVENSARFHGKILFTNYDDAQVARGMM